MHGRFCAGHLLEVIVTTFTLTACMLNMETRTGQAREESLSGATHCNQSKCNTTFGAMEQYAIVEFIDGLQMIPSSWITENNKYAYWPTFTSNEKFRKAVQKCISKMDDWPQHEIKRILATASTYEKGIKKLKTAEFISDLNSESEDNDTLKRSRKYRAKTVISSEESLSEEEKRVRVPSYPKVPHKKNLDKQSYENSSIKMPLKNKNVSKLTEYENNNSNINLNKTNVETFSSSINKNTGRDFNQNNVKEKEFSSETYETGSTISTTDFQRYVVRKLLDIDFKISTVHEEQKNINTKLDSIQNQIQTFVLDDGVKKKDVEVDYMELFPLQTLEELEKFEQQLVENKINRKALITQVARIGGTDVKSLTFNILRRLLSDSVGSLYSYIGGKKKRSFFDLYLRKIIFGAVRIYFPETTEQKISEPIKSWLRHASERSMKKKNMDKRADIVSTQEDEDQAEEMTLNELTGPNI